MILCRLAEHAFWFGRYVERAEDLARALLSYEDIRLDLPGQPAPGWQRLAGLAGVAPEDLSGVDSARAVASVILDCRRPSSVLGALHAARENLRRSRALFPSSCWDVINPLYLDLAAAEPTLSPAERRSALARVVATGRQLAGHIRGGMLRDEGYAFMRVGVHLERADMTLRILTAVAETLIPEEESARFEDVRWTGLLKAVGAFGGYRHLYHARTSFGDALELLLVEPAFPRSLSHVLREIGRDLNGLPRHARVLLELDDCRPKTRAKTRAALTGFAEDELARLAKLSAAIAATYFSPTLTARTATDPEKPRREHDAPDRVAI